MADIANILHWKPLAETDTDTDSEILNHRKYLTDLLEKKCVRF